MRTKLRKRYLWLMAAVAAAVLLYQYFRPLPPVQAQLRTPPAPKTAAISLPWPDTGQAAIGADGYGLLASHNVTAPQSTASIAKIITAMAVLQKKPLSAGSQGPTITLDSTDADYFNYYYTHDGSVAKVSAGEQITEYQMLQAMLIPSANNIADSLARWAFGSTDSYIAYAKRMVSGLGLSQTTVGNTNGFDDTTTSTADDLVKLGIQALKNPVIADIVSQKTASVPVQGQIKNVNWLLGVDGVIGIKTGNTDKAGGCYLFAAKHQVSGKTITLVGAVMGERDLGAALTAGRDLEAAADAGFTDITAVKPGQTLAVYQAPWGVSAPAETSQGLSILAWKGSELEISDSPVSLAAPAPAGAAAGTVTLRGGGQTAGAPLRLSKALPGPSLWWRLTRH